MEKDDVELIRSILSGDDSAFSDLVQKYQKSVHALAWRQIGDFQVAEEITQDTFLQAYKKLATLKNPNQFAGWLYVITRNLCTDWHRRKKPTMKSLEATKTKTLEKTAYERYLAEEREKAAAEHRRELVKNLLEKLPESERTVVTLHYLGEMTSEAISKFLGVSVNTIKSRLRRARKRLQEEEPMIRETLGGVQLPADLTGNIMEQIAHIKPIPASSSKPLVPWAALGSAAVLVILLLGASNQLLTRFQKPYSLAAQSETAIEIVDTSILLDIQSEPDTQRQIGSSVLANNNGAGQEVSDAAIAANDQADSSKISVTTHQWTQARGPQGGNIHEIFLTTEGKLLTVTPTGIYQMTEDATEWVQINNTLPTEVYSEMPMAEREDTLYIVADREIFASTNGGVNWNPIGSRPNGTAIDLLITDEAFYLVMDNEIFRSTDAGKQWHLFNDGLKDREITAAAAIGNTVFVGTNRGLYRLNSGIWKHLPVGKFRTINSLAISENTLYVGMTPSDSSLTSSELKTKFIREMMRSENSNSWEIFRSDDLGNSWMKITPRNKSLENIVSRGAKILVSGKTILVFGTIHSYRSEDGGQTWTYLGVNMDSITITDSPALALDESTFYKEGFYILQRTIDAGESWHSFMKGMIGNKFDNLITFNDRLYVHSDQEIVQSSDGGDTWTTVPDESEKNEFLNLFSRKITVANDTLYAVARDAKNRTRICRLSSKGDLLVPIQGMPAIDENIFSNEFRKNIGESEDADISNYNEKVETLEEQIRNMRAMLNSGDVVGIAVAGETFYVAHARRLFKWRPGFPKWMDTGLNIDKDCKLRGSNLAASRETVYVGRDDGKLFQSLDVGKSWKDITSTLPLEFGRFKEIVFAGSTVHVATDNGVLTSESGQYWRVLTDSSGKNIVIASLAVDGNTVYGVGDAGIFELNDDNEWQKISPEVPDEVRDLVIHNDKFYIVTNNRGMFHIPLKKENR
ncbi:MAG: sigma-70 family RNA polymerase sigma factor [Candidatus Poribacteria bacterium]|nr:sigma-70 family RNA polymerase sigma factor [Candidatus Poribacteria bacterium]